MDLTKQASAPLYEAMEKFRKKRIVPFDVPGHKRGRGNPELIDLLGERCVGIDVNSMKPLDNLSHPVSVIKEAEELTADAFGAEHAFFIVGGTTQAVQDMVLSVCKSGDEIIVPRNVHKSVLNALILCGATPVYVNTEIDARLGIVLGMTVEQVEEVIVAHPKAVAVLINNPTYYGICSDIKSITDMVHRHGLKVLADEAHGTHLYFGDHLPMNAMEAGADMAAISMHKSGGSLTQSSILLTGNGMNANYVQTIINITQTTSASYLLLTSLDISRRNLALRGRQSFQKVTEWAEYAREEINSIGGYYAYGRELVNGTSVYDFDVTKLCVFTRDIGLDGIEVYDILRDEFDIQIEFGDIGNIMAYISIGDRIQDIERLVGALAEISRIYSKDGKQFEIDRQMLLPEVIKSPQEAFYAAKERRRIHECVGYVSGEFVMAYPPGIPILAPGELVTEDIVDYILYSKEKGCSMQGQEDPSLQTLNVLKER
ncbi:MAG: aminotransferase class I/II-fold pyridoxal phosphate-dependent enzyme [Lachnospiraceae bacterium]|nr:aminotransferase class I/II-fold pyridoxal phosphate-dependent enzyme [Lachnospiraceae bacterium]